MVRGHKISILHCFNKSRIIEESVKWRSFDQTVKRVRRSFSDMPGEELQSLIHEAIASIRDRERQSETANRAIKANNLLTTRKHAHGDGG
jgi:hypothetical protein